MPDDSSDRKILELWSDSFKEGEWFVEELMPSYSPTKNYEGGFQPVYELETPSTRQKICVEVYGDYGAWSPRPEIISSLLEIGKPDAMLYDAEEDKVVMGLEETAAVPTGNQALQRLERVWHAAENEIPFAYLMPEYGLHDDGGLRRNSIWPAYLAMKLSLQYEIPSLAFMYGDTGHPTGYDVGPGLEQLRSFISFLIDGHLGDPHEEADATNMFVGIFTEMADFIHDHAGEITSYLPRMDALTEPAYIELMVRDFRGEAISRDEFEQLYALFSWPKARELAAPCPPSVLHKQDALLEKLEELVRSRKAWLPIEGSTRRCETADKLEAWLKKQDERALLICDQPPAWEFTPFDLAEFPTDARGKKTVTTSSNILYMVDEARDFISAYEESLRSSGWMENEIDCEKGVMLYISNSVVDNGRAFSGDPFTGQAAGYTKVFATQIDNVKTHNVIAYYPNQQYTQLFEARGRQIRSNKGVKMLHNLADLLLFKDGKAVRPTDWMVLN